MSILICSSGSIYSFISEAVLTCPASTSLQCHVHSHEAGPCTFAIAFDQGLDAKPGQSVHKWLAEWAAQVAN